MKLAVLMRLLAPALACASGCGQADTPAPHSSSLPAGVVARIADSDVWLESVERIALAQRVPLGRARDIALSDAAFAEQAVRVVPVPMQRALERASSSRALLESLLRDAASRGPPTDDEIAKITAERWIDLDRPASARVTHAVALRPKDGSPEAARRVAEALAEAVRGITEPEAFLRAARGVKAEGVQVRAERLPAVTPDGKGFTLEGGSRPAGEFDAAFAKAANRLSEPGEQSGIVETRFGFHVLLLEEKIPEVRIPLEDRRIAFASEVLARRADDLRRALVERLSRESAVAVSRDAAAQTARLAAGASDASR